MKEPDERRRLWLSLGLALGSPVFAALLSVSVIAVGGRLLPGFGSDIGRFTLFADGALAAGSAASGVLLPTIPLGGRVALAITFGLTAFFAHWALGGAILILIHGF